MRRCRNWRLGQHHRSPMLWHFNFRGPDEEAPGAGPGAHLPRSLLEELSGDPKGIDEDTRQHYAALYARPHAMHDAFEQFGAFSQDAATTRRCSPRAAKITMPVFALGAEKFFGKGMADEMRSAASNVTGGIVPSSGTDHGGESTGHHQVGYGFPRQVACASDNLTRGVKLSSCTLPGFNRRRRNYG